MNSLKNIACSNLADQILLVGKRIGNDDDAVAKVYDHFGDLPYSLAQDLWNDCLDKEDLQTAHVAILLHPNMTTLDLEEHTSPDHYFDLAKLIEWAGHKMKQLLIFRLASPVPKTLLLGERLCYSLPNLEVLSLRDVELSEEFFQSLSVNLPRLTSLRISYHNASAGLLILCHEQSLVRKNLKYLDVRCVSLSVEVGIAILQSFVNLERFKCDLSILDLIHSLYTSDKDGTMGKRFAIDKLWITYKTNCLMSVPTDDSVSPMEVATIICPNVTALSWKCSIFDGCSMMNPSDLDLISRFFNLKSLSLNPCSVELSREVCLADVLPIISSHESRLIKLKLTNFAHLRPITRITSFKFENLKILSYKDNLNFFSPPTSFWALLLSHCPRLEYINITLCASFDDKALLLLSKAPRLENLHLDTCSAVTNEGVLSFLRSSCSVFLKIILLFKCSRIRDDDFSGYDTVRVIH